MAASTVWRHWQSHGLKPHIVRGFKVLRDRPFVEKLKGKYPAELNEWRRTVVEAKSKRDGFHFWYRNPQQPGQSSLGIAYLEDKQLRIVRPDFIFFAEQDGKVVVDLVDPHGFHLADVLPKLQGLAAYANEHADVYRRIEAVPAISQPFEAHLCRQRVGPRGNC